MKWQSGVAIVVSASLMACGSSRAASSRSYVVVAPKQCADDCPNVTPQKHAMCMADCSGSRTMYAEACQDLALSPESACETVRPAQDPEPNDHTGRNVAIVAGGGVFVVLMILLLTSGGSFAIGAH